MTETQLSTIWKLVLKELELSISGTVFKTWFKKSSLLSLKPGFAEIGVENNFAKNAIKKYAEERLVGALSKQAGFPVTSISYIIQEVKTATQQDTSTLTLEATITPTSTVPVFQLNSKEAPVQSNLNPRYTFSTFIVGNRNRLAYAAAKAVSERPGIAYNPLYLYGGVGLGKTHLMQAVGNEIISHEPQKRVLYVSCENFTNEFVYHLQKGKIDDFKKKYRTIDVFLIDDIQFIAGKAGSQEEFFHTFNALYQTNRQIILTSDKVPSEIPNLEERLSSRFAQGMIADMQLPDLETRQAILLAKCQEKGIGLPDETLLFIAERVETNIRELEGALTTVLMHLEANQLPATLDSVQQALRSFHTSQKPLKKTSIEQICSIVCEYYNVELKDIQGPHRQKELVKPRQIIMYLLKNELGLTFPAIGRQIGGRDHTTAMHSVEKIEKEMKKSTELLEELKRIKELFYVSSTK